MSFKVTPGMPSVQKYYLTKPEKQAVEGADTDRDG